MKYEVEQKFRLQDLFGVQQRLEALGAVFGPAIEQADSYFAHPARDFGQTDEALRLRQVGSENCITYKGPKLDAQTKTRREIELPLAAGEAAYQQFAELLEAIGFHQVLTVRKCRQPGKLSWKGMTVHIALDNVSGLGEFLELEVAADESTLAAGRAAIVELAAQLGLPASERRSYLEMLVESMA